jgi:hypothetical protein
MVLTLGPVVAEAGFLEDGAPKASSRVTPTSCSGGRGDSDDFCVHTVGTKPGRDHVTIGAHIAFCASDAGSVMRWHDAALGHGGTDIGAWRAPRVQREILRRIRPRS